MHVQTTKPVEFWRDLERRVTSRTGAVLEADDRDRRPVITYLREVEAMVRVECDQRQTIQIIASARRVLGDRSTVGVADGPFRHTMGDAP